MVPRVLRLHPKTRERLERDGAYGLRSGFRRCCSTPKGTPAGGSRPSAGACVSWACSLWDAMQPHFRSGVYSNYLQDVGEERVTAAYGANYARFVALKNKYDPTNFFRLNQNIKPTV